MRFKVGQLVRVYGGAEKTSYTRGGGECVIVHAKQLRGYNPKTKAAK